MKIGGRKYFLFSLISGILWGISPPLIKIILKYFNEYDIAFLRSIFSFFIIFIYNLIYLKKSNFKLMLINWRSTLPYAFSGYILFWILFNLGVKYSTAIEASFIINFYILITLVFSWIYYDNPFRWSEFIGVITGLIGVYLVLARDSIFILESSSLVGDVFTLFSALSWAGYTILLKYHGQKESPELSFQYQLFYATLFLLPISFSSGLNTRMIYIPIVFLFIILLTIFSTILAFLLYIKSVIHLTPFQIGMTLISSPLTTCIISLLFLGEYLTPLQYFGGSLIVISIIFSYIE